MTEQTTALRIPLTQSAVSFAGMLLCFFTCTGILLNVSGDQTGTQLAETTASFQSSLNNVGGDSAFSDVRFPSGKILTGKSSATPFGQQHLAGSSPQLPRENLSNRRMDRNAPVFANLLNELRRFCEVSPTEHFEAEFAVDVLSLTGGTEHEIQQSAVDLIHRIQTQSGSKQWEFELICWAGSPQKRSLSDSALRAASVKQNIERDFAAEEVELPRIISSGRIWSSPNALRPSLTVVVRRI